MSVKIVGLDGKPLINPQQQKMRALVWGSLVPYDAAEIFSDQLAYWQPALWSPDNEINLYRDRIVSRVCDLARNDGWAESGMPLPYRLSIRTD
uniref:Uncharacterized protein n=1 Tax=Arsenophonus endosymbiont of Trialeurodes vaporariorum TaxID=235567 RepID=A0A3B0MM23_9GAMM